MAVVDVDHPRAAISARACVERLQPRSALLHRHQATEGFHCSGWFQVITAKFEDRRLNLGVTQGGDERSGSSEGVAAERDVVGLPGQGYEAQAQVVGGGAHAQTYVRDTGGDEQLVQQDAGAGADLAFDDPQRGEGRDAGSTSGVAGCDEQALFSAPQMQKVRPAVTEQGVRTVAVGGYSATAALSALIGVATSVVQVGVLRGAAWAARGLRVPARNALLADVVPAQMYGRAYGFERMMDNRGAIVGPLLALGLVSLFSVRTAILLSIIPGLLAAVAIVYAIRQADLPKVTGRRKLCFQVRPVLKGQLGRVMAGFTAFEVGNVAATLFILRATDVLTPARGVNAATQIAIALYVVYNVAATITSFPAGGFSDKLGRRGPLLVTATGVAAFLLAYGLFAVSGPVIVLLGVAFAVAGVGIAVHGDITTGGIRVPGGVDADRAGDAGMGGSTLRSRMPDSVTPPSAVQPVDADVDLHVTAQRRELTDRPAGCPLRDLGRWRAGHAGSLLDRGGVPARYGRFSVGNGTLPKIGSASMRPSTSPQAS